MNDFERGLSRYFTEEELQKIRRVSIGIAGALSLKAHEAKISAENIEEIFSACDIIVEALDDVKAKLFLVDRFGGSDRIVTRRINDHFYVVGDFMTDVAEAPPYAPCVMIAAAKQADVVLEIVLGGTGKKMKKIGMDNFNTTGIYALTAEELSKGRSNVEVVAALINAGITFLQYREKEKAAGEMYRECLEIRKMTQEAGVTFIVNDHIDLALAVKADGVHIGQTDLPPEVVRALIGEEMILGLSTHDQHQLARAEESGVVDYVGVGPVFATKTKKDVGEAVGLSYVSYAAEHSKLPFVAIGGIKEHNLHEVAAAGAKTFAIVSDIVGADDICHKVKAFRDILVK